VQWIKRGDGETEASKTFFPVYSKFNFDQTEIDEVIIVLMYSISAIVCIKQISLSSHMSIPLYPPS
jgi:hypothetical protein